MYDGILELENKTWMVYVQIQDGTEQSGPYQSLEQAIKSYKDGQAVMNHRTKIKTKEIPLYKEEKVVVTQVKRIN